MSAPPTMPDRRQCSLELWLIALCECLHFRLCGTISVAEDTDVNVNMDMDMDTDVVIGHGQHVQN